MKHPLISIVMPAFNAGKYIREAIDSVLNQSFKDWELIIVDDASTDDTYCIAKEYTEKDDRIKLYSLSINSGTVQVPRLKAISLASGDWILGLDSDDYIARNDLESLYNRALATQADVVLHRLVAVNENGVVLGDAIPSWDFDLNDVFTGKEACMKTIVTWDICGNGIYKSELYDKLCRARNVTNINSDEYDTRFLFLNASKVALCGAEYYYRQNLESITKKVNIKRFDVADLDKDLDILIKKEFGIDSWEYSRMIDQRINNLIALTRLYIQNKYIFNDAERRLISQRLRNNYQDVEKKYSFPTSFSKRLLLANGWHLFYIVVFIYFCFKD